MLYFQTLEITSPMRAGSSLSWLRYRWFGDDDDPAHMLMLMMMMMMTYMTVTTPSTTFPGCWETATWVVMNKPVYLSRSDSSSSEMSYSRFIHNHFQARVGHVLPVEARQQTNGKSPTRQQFTTQVKIYALFICHFLFIFFKWFYSFPSFWPRW